MTSSVTKVEYFMAYVLLTDLRQGTGTEQQAKDGKSTSYKTILILRNKLTIFNGRSLPFLILDSIAASLSQELAKTFLGT